MKKLTPPMIDPARVNLGSLVIPVQVEQLRPHITPTSPVITSVPTLGAPTALQIPTLASFNINNVRYVNPRMGALLARFPVERDSFPRDKVTVPISPTSNITNEVLFEEPTDASKKLYLPCYKLGEVKVNGLSQFSASLERSGEGGSLTLVLLKYADPVIQEAARNAKELHHIPSVLLSYTIGSVGVKKELNFQDLTFIDGGIRVVLRVGTLAEYSELYQSLTSRDYNTSLIIRRTFQVAIPVGDSLFRQRTAVVDDEKRPFYFDVNLHKYIFHVHSGSASQSPGLIRHDVDGKSYYQEYARPYVFYYTPDCFKIARRPESPHIPFMSLRFESSDGLPESTQVTVEYAAAPFTDSKRLISAAEKLKSKLPQTLPPGIIGPMFMPMLADEKRISFSLGLPSASPEKSTFQKRVGVLIDPRYMLVDSVRMPLEPDFQYVWDAMVGSSSVALFRGEIVIELGDGLGKISEKIPFIGRMDDMAGEIFDYTKTADDGSVKAVISNAIESKIQINRLNATLNRGGAEVPATVTGFNVPAELKPGQQVTLNVVPTAALSGSGSLDAVFDLSQVVVIPDPEAIWNAVIVSKKQEYSRSVRIVTFKQMFEDQQIKEIALEFERGKMIRLTAEKLEVEAAINFPLADVILSKQNSGEYRYRIHVVRVHNVKVSEWKVSNLPLLYIVSDDVLPAK